jgi:hypothetical protein
MSLSTDELLIRKFLGEQRITPEMPSGGRVIPAPIFFNDKEDYWATIESVSYTTQFELETEHIFFCSFYFQDFVDIQGPPDSPLIGLRYELYVFAQYDLERTDENISPDAFNKKMLKHHNELVKCALDLKEAFQGKLNIGVLDTAEYAVQRTTPLVQNQFLANKEQCVFVPGVMGHAVRFQETVQIQKIAC